MTDRPGLSGERGRAGGRVLLHVDIEVDGRPTATLGHEAIVSLASEG